MKDRVLSWVAGRLRAAAQVVEGIGQPTGFVVPSESPPRTCRPRRVTMAPCPRDHVPAVVPAAPKKKLAKTRLTPKKLAKAAPAPPSAPPGKAKSLTADELLEAKRAKHREHSRQSYHRKRERMGQPVRPRVASMLSGRTAKSRDEEE